MNSPPPTDRAQAGHDARARYRETILEQPVAWWLLVFVAGIMVDAYCQLPTAIWLFLALAHLAGSLIAWRDPASLLLLATGFLSTGALSHAAFQRLVSSEDIAAITVDEGFPAIIEGKVDGRFRRWKGQRGSRWSVPIRVTRIRDRGQWRKARGRAIVIGHGNWASEPGWSFRWHGIVVRPNPSKNPGEIDSRQQLLAQQIHVEIRLPQSATPQAVGGHPNWSLAESIRRRACEITVATLPRQHASLIQAMTWGERGSLTYRQKQRFLTTGTVHYLAISGLHLGMLCGLLSGLNRLEFLPRRVVRTGVILFAFGYTLVCGARTPIVRATWLVTVSVLGRWNGRRTLQWSRLAAAGWGVLLFRPTDLWDAGAQLSFLAVAILLLPRASSNDDARNDDAGNDDAGNDDAGNDETANDRPPEELGRAIKALLHLARPRWQQRLIRICRHGRDVYRVNWNVCVQMAPLLAFHFEFLALGALIYSPLIGPPVAIALVTSFLLVLFSAVPLVAAALRASCIAALVAIDAVLSTAGPAPPVWQIPQASIIAVRLFYFTWFVRYGFGGQPMRGVWRWRIVLTLLWCAALFGPLVRPPVWDGTNSSRSKSESNTTDVSRQQAGNTKNALTLSFVSVGHGLAVIVQTPAGETWLYDAGSTGDGRYAARHVDGILSEMGVQRLSGIIVSHFDSDHYNATDRLVEKYPTGCLVSSDPRVHAWCRQTGGFPKSTMSIVPPNPDWPIANLGRLVAGTEHGGDNERSLALFGAQGEHTFCLTGDLEGEGLEGLLSSPIDELDVLLVPHHGSLHSQPARVAEWARPHWAIISGGWQDRRPEVLAAYERVGATVLHTHDGAVRVVLKPGTEPKVTQWRQGKWRKSASRGMLKNN